ncbi:MULTISPECIES: hypothetical protein [unclassified Cryobacterium]|uniref:hypothetical protein n=1 Tax=unclassified Cryobacterium TaxID=2649013 RepID=UPI002AB35DCF|nr:MULTISPECIES: hypothetical protein [unclassified Cryobacterium]MDY7542916.1 hypothetical protein [Cryobacterium sp. 5B3]MEA9999240.1 hypothetical protein [Cryobacterium sp. RTS3]MEB0265375.1 hypothetical protein [Cryobacterium sp. 10I5]MEB0274895.1 hypothetical protein [Cryobacterium sp. 5B3]
MWFFYGFLQLATATIVPLGILLHGVRADVRDQSSHALESAEQSGWESAAVTHVRRARLSAGTVSGLLIVDLLWVSWFSGWFGGAPDYSANWLPRILPMSIAAAAILVLVLLPSRSRGTGRVLAAEMDLQPRNLGSFGSPWWFVAWLLSAVALVLTVVLAGLVSSPDEEGRYSILIIDLGSASARGDFLGWFYGVPLLCALGVLMVLTLLALWSIARPTVAMRAARTVDIQLRRLQTRTVLSLSSGALLVTLGLAWISIGSAGRMYIGTTFPGVGDVKVGSPLEAIAMPLWAAGFVVEGLGLALIMLPVFTRRIRVSSSVATPRPVPANTGADVERSEQCRS